MGDLNRFAGNGQFLRKEDCPQPIVATIARTGEHSFEGKAPQLVLYFQQPNVKPLACNSTNTRLLIALLGVQTEEQLIGRSIEIYNDPSIMMRGQVVGGLRVRLPQQHQPPTVPQQPVAVPQQFQPPAAQPYPHPTAAQQPQYQQPQQPGVDTPW